MFRVMVKGLSDRVWVMVTRNIGERLGRNSG